MIVHKLKQGTPEWHDFRAKHFTASDAPAMMGVSSYKTRADLLKEKAVGVTGDVDAATQRLFDDGHRFEALARPLAEAIIGDDLYPVVGSDGKLAASFDGLTLCQSINFEHKTLNAAIEACQTADDLPGMYHIQVQQQMGVSGAQRTLFMATRWDENDQLVAKREFWIERDEVFIAGIKQGWEQFGLELSTYEHVEIIEKPKGAAVIDLPAVMVNVSGQISITDNLGKFTTALTSFIEQHLITKPESDQDFADLESQIKTLKKAEDALDSAEANMLAQVDAVDTAKRMIDMARKMARDNRLMAEKLVKSEKERIKTDRIMLARNQFMDHVSALNAEISPAKIEGVTPDFNGAAKNKRTMASLYDALDTELARVKIEADAQAKMIRANLAVIAQHEAYRFLFNDLATIAHKAPDDFAALVAHRVNEHRAAEEARIEAERERIRQQEEAKAKAEADRVIREAAEKAAREKQQAEAEVQEKIRASQRAAAEELERQNAAAKVAAEKAAETQEDQSEIRRGAQMLIDADTPPTQETIDIAARSSEQTETVLVIRHQFTHEFIRKMVADSLEKYGVEVDSVEIEGAMA